MQIEITEPALQNLTDIKEYIGHDSQYYANIFINTIFDRIDNILPFPKAGRIVPEYENQNIREIIYHNYRIIYLIHEGADAIYILTVIHGSRDLNRHLNIDDI